MRTGFDFDDFLDLIDEHKGTLGIIALSGLAAITLFPGGQWQKLQTKFERDGAATQAISSQAEAETIFNSVGCSAQVVDSRTKTANFQEGSIAIDPLSITAQNPNGTPIQSGHICGLDGSVFRIENGVARLVGTSPKIREQLVVRGIPRHVQAMEQYVQQFYQGGQRNGL